ncbi:MaoC family dehydratase [Nocardiopsis alborubida]|uniref:MaoC-like domain-containing protein n=1 Tax=Nocardiopsis alborubida TaxID=146802 RepID=A0A7X6M9E2_9ACTN|nr:MaoC/PaaZ C-terminal domain-containing protein [Nocardiopsis alborubida]NKY97186.1 hypothetical protein [Nocardiopsis alborubida]
MVDRSRLVGRTHRSDTITIDPDHAEAFSAVVGHEPRSHRGRPVVSPFYAAFVVAPLWRRIYQAPELGTRDQLVLHAEQRMLWHRHLYAGQRVWATLLVSDVVGFGFNDAAIIRCRLREDDGTLLSTMESTLTIRGDSGFSPRSTRTANPRRVGTAASATHTFDTDAPQRYADVADDHNPLHLDDEAAREAGHPGRILHGMCTLATGVTALAGRLSDGRPRRLGFVRTRFARPVLPGSTLDLTAHTTTAAGVYALTATLGGRAVLKNTLMGLAKEEQ